MTSRLEIHEQAYAFFEQTYLREHPLPVRSVAAKSGQWERGFYLLVTGASILVGASHTVPMVLGHPPTDAWGWLIALAIVTMLELALVMSAYRRFHSAMSHTDARGRAKIMTHSTSRLGYNISFVFMVLVAVQVFYMLESRSVIEVGSLWYDRLNLVVSLMIAFAPPVQGWFFGEVFAALQAETIVRQDELDTSHAQAVAAHEQQKQGSWNARKKALISEMADASPSVSRDVSRDEPRVVETSRETIKRQIDNPLRVARHLQAHPEDAQLTVSALAAKLDIPRATAGRALQDFKNAQQEDTSPQETIPDSALEGAA